LVNPALWWGFREPPESVKSRYSRDRRMRRMPFSGPCPGTITRSARGVVIDGIRPRKSGSHQTHRWRKTDSNCRSLSRECRLMFAEEKGLQVGQSGQNRPSVFTGDLRHRLSERCSLGNLMPWRRLHVNSRDPFRPCRNVDENDFWFTPVPLQRAPQPRGRAKVVRVRVRWRAAAPARDATLRGGDELP